MQSYIIEKLVFRISNAYAHFLDLIENRYDLAKARAHPGPIQPIPIQPIQPTAQDDGVENNEEENVEQPANKIINSRGGINKRNQQSLANLDGNNSEYQEDQEVATSAQIESG